MRRTTISPPPTTTGTSWPLVRGRAAGRPAAGDGPPDAGRRARRPVIPGAAARSGAAIASDVRGRLRLRLPVGWPGAEVEARLREVPGVSESCWTARTRSVLVTYRPDAETRTRLLAAVEGLGLGAPTGERLAAESPASPTGSPTLARALSGMFDEADVALVRATRGVLDLRTGVP